MKIGVFSRLMSYLVDIIPIISIVSLLLTWFVGDIIKEGIHEDFDHLEELYYENLEEYEAIVDPIYTRYTNEEITYDEYLELATPIRDDFVNNNIYLYDIVFISWWISAAAYLIISTNIIYYIYLLIMKGNTFGRKIMRIQLKGNVTWYSLLLREIIWKHFFWYATLGIGILWDFFSIVFTKKKRTIRDMFTRTYLAPEGVDYPF